MAEAMFKINDTPFDKWPEVLTPAEVADLFRVGVKAVRTWAETGRLNSFRTPGGHRRFMKKDVYDLYNRED